jgi:hypothetical protein
MRNHDLPIGRYLALADDAVGLLEQALAMLHGDPDPIRQPAVTNLFGAADALGFALARYRAEYPEPRADTSPF